MAYTKRQFIEGAFEEIGLASYVFDLSPSQMESALRRLDAMMATWNGMGIRLGYPLPVNPDDGELTENSGVPDSANEAIITNLAIRLAPGYGKSVQPQTLATAKASYNVLLQRAAAPLEMAFPATMPVGAGWKPYSIDDPFFGEPDPTVDAGPDGPLEFT